MEVAILFAMVIGLMLIGVPIAVSAWHVLDHVLAGAQRHLAWPLSRRRCSKRWQGITRCLRSRSFMLASTFMSTGGVAKRIIRFLHRLVGHFPGGLAIAGVFACMMFAALSGSSPATVVAIGSIVIAGMRQVAIPRTSPQV